MIETKCPMQIPHTIWNPRCNSVCCLLVVSSFFRLSLVIDKTIFVQTFTCLCLLNEQLCLWNLVLCYFCLWNCMLLSTEILEFPTSFFHMDLIKRTHFTAKDFNPKTSISFCLGQIVFSNSWLRIDDPVCLCIYY